MRNLIPKQLDCGSLDWTAKVCYFSISQTCWWWVSQPTSLVSFLISLIFNLHPPQPWYLFVWDVKAVVNFKFQWGSTDAFSGRKMSLELCMLLALTTASTASSLHHLDIRSIVSFSSKATFYSHKLHRNWKKGKPRLW